MLADAVLSRIAERDVARRERVAETAAARSVKQCLIAPNA